MAIQQDKLGLEVYKILAAREYGYNMTMYDTESSPTTTPIKAKWIYVKPVNFMIQLPDPDAHERPEIYFWKQQGEHDEVIEQLIQRIRTACNQFGVGLTVNDFAEDNVPKQYAKLVARHNEEQQIDESIRLDEGMIGNSKRSYYIMENARLVCVHSRRINEEVKGARSRNIKEIYVESKGERYRYPTNYLQGAKAMCRHINDGGAWTDVVGTAIQESGLEIRSLGRLIEECKASNCLPIIERAQRYVKGIKLEMRQMQGPRGYKRLSEQIQTLPRLAKGVVESRCASLASVTGLTESPELLESYKYFAKRDLREDKLNENSYKAVIEQSVQGVAPGMARKASRAVTKGNVTFAQPMSFTPAACGNPEEKALLLSSMLSKCVDNDLVAVALSEIAERGTCSPEDAKFVYGVLKSAKMNQHKTTPPELVELMDWVNKVGKKL